MLVIYLLSCQQKYRGVLAETMVPRKRKHGNMSKSRLAKLPKPAPMTLNPPSNPRDPKTQTLIPTPASPTRPHPTPWTLDPKTQQNPRPPP